MEKKTIYMIWNHDDPEYTFVTTDWNEIIDYILGEDVDEEERENFNIEDYDFYLETCEVGDNRYFVVSNDDESGFIEGVGKDWNEITKRVRDEIREQVETAREEEEDYIEGYALNDVYEFYIEEDDYPEVFDTDVDIEKVVDELYEEFESFFKDSYVDGDSSSQYHIYDVVEDKYIM